MSGGRSITSGLELDQITKKFGDVVALDDVTLMVNPGEFFSLLGPSGCGKTTTLRVVGGFEDPDGGRVRLGGVDITEEPPNHRPVNTVFQSYALFPHLNVFDNVAYGLRRKGVDRSETKQSVMEILETVDLTGLEQRKPAQLSGGQQQRVALARALVNRPQVLLLDEPLGALDLKLRRTMQAELKRIQHDVGITFVYVTHDQDEAMTMSDRLAVMSAGRVEQVGTPADVYERPATEFVASFLGAANLLEGEVAQCGDGWATVVLADGASVRVGVDDAHLPARIKVGVRPEKIRIAEAEPPTGNAIAATLEIVAFSGVGHECTFRTVTGERVVVWRQNVGTSLPAPGTHVWLTWRPEHSFLLNTG